MAIVLKPKRSGTAGLVPTTTNLADGELAVNYTDKAVYIRAGASIVKLADLTSGGYLPLTGGTITGNLAINGEVSIRNGAAGTQSGLCAYGWSGGATRHMTVLEADSSLATYSYDANGSAGKRVMSLANRAIGQTTSWIDGALRVAGWNGDVQRGLLYLGANGAYIYGRGSDMEFYTPGVGYGVLNSGGTILTTGNFNPASKQDARPELNALARITDNWNSAVNSGWWRSYNGANAPVGGWLIGIVTAHTAAWITQDLWEFANATSSPRRWKRHLQEGYWSSWQNIGEIIVSATDPGGMDGTIWVQP